MAEKSVVSLSNLLEVRRLLRSIRLDTNKNIKNIKPMTRYLNTSSINALSDKIRIRYCSNISIISKNCMNNIKLLLHIQILLNTHLLEQTNLHKKLLNLNSNLIKENEELKVLADNAVSNMSTKFKSPINIITDDIAKKLKTNEKRILSDGEDTWGIITLRLKETLYCVLWQREEKFYLKTYINELPPELNDNNNIEFQSPSQAFSTINKIIQEDGL